MAGGESDREVTRGDIADAVTTADVVALQAVINVVINAMTTSPRLHKEAVTDVTVGRNLIVIVATKVVRMTVVTITAELIERQRRSTWTSTATSEGTDGTIDVTTVEIIEVIAEMKNAMAIAVGTIHVETTKDPTDVMIVATMSVIDAMTGVTNDATISGTTATDATIDEMRSETIDEMSVVLRSDAGLET